MSFQPSAFLKVMPGTPSSFQVFGGSPQNGTIIQISESDRLRRLVPGPPNDWCLDNCKGHWCPYVSLRQSSTTQERSAAGCSSKGGPPAMRGPLVCTSCRMTCGQPICRITMTAKSVSTESKALAQSRASPTGYLPGGNSSSATTATSSDSASKPRTCPA